MIGTMRYSVIEVGVSKFLQQYMETDFSQTRNQSGKLQLAYLTPLRSKWRKINKLFARTWSKFWKNT